MRLDNTDGVKLLLEQYHAIKERRYLGDPDAFAILEDLHTAIRLADLTPTQQRSLDLVFIEDLSQVEAGLVMGRSRQKTYCSVKAALIKIAAVFEGWANAGEGYSLEDVEVYGAI